jgi:diguanylate cyclase (GGDEF)-like protein
MGGKDTVVLVHFLLTGVSVLLAFLAAVTWSRRREAPEATTFALLVASMAIYAFGYAGEVAQSSTAAALAWLHVEYLALPWAGALWVLAACAHNGIKVRKGLLFIVPVVTFAGHYTNPYHLFYRGPMTLAHRGPFWVLVADRGPLSTLDNAYLLVCFLAGSWVYISRVRHASPLFRKQALIMVFASILPLIGYFLYLGNLSPWGLDTGPATLGVTCALLFYGIFYCGVFDLAPLARTLIFNTIRDAVLVLDTRDRLLDFNPAAALILPELKKKEIGLGIDAFVAEIPGLAKAIAGGENSAEFELATATGTQFFEIRTWPLFSSSSTPGRGRLGRAIIVADVTTQVRLREELRRYAETDALTGIANRRRFQQALEIECIRFTHGHTPFSVLMIDLDNFKEINDRYGHPAGDAVLCNLAQRLLLSLRKADLLARYGGEEFSVLLPETGSEDANVIAERVRLAVCRAPVEVDGMPIPITVSVGVGGYAAENKVDPQSLLKKADLALYRAKANGRNRVESS